MPPGRTTPSTVAANTRKVRYAAEQRGDRARAAHEAAMSAARTQAQFKRNTAKAGGLFARGVAARKAARKANP